MWGEIAALGPAGTGTTRLGLESIELVSIQIHPQQSDPERRSIIPPASSSPTGGNAIIARECHMMILSPLSHDIGLTCRKSWPVCTFDHAIYVLCLIIQ